MKIIKAFVTLFILGLIVFSCSPKLAPDSNWAEGKWILIELKQVPVQITANGRANANLEFSPSVKTFQGFGGCNKINGTYTISKSKIKFTTGPVSTSDCLDLPFENTFISLLNQADGYAVEGNIMTLKDGKNDILKFQRK